MCYLLKSCHTGLQISFLNKSSYPSYYLHCQNWENSLKSTFEQKYFMKLFTTFHNPATKKYIIYYSVVLAIVSITIFLSTIQLIHQNILQNAATLFEGFFSLFMLSRNEKVGKAFLSHITTMKGLVNPMSSLS